MLLKKIPSLVLYKTDVNLDRIKSVSGSINATLVSRIYETLDHVGFSIFCATSED